MKPSTGEGNDDDDPGGPEDDVRCSPATVRMGLPGSPEPQASGLQAAQLSSHPTGSVAGGPSSTRFSSRETPESSDHGSAERAKTPR
ncbi:hypothetical protein DTO212C5_5882 [Paecilomyces variotii]|nr:hypothetical protein DTO212C5_5882 [Paecilomyces variotii]